LNLPATVIRLERIEGDQQVLQGIIVGKNIIRVSKNIVDYLVKSAIRICLLVNVD